MPAVDLPNGRITVHLLFEDALHFSISQTRLFPNTTVDINKTTVIL